MSRRPVAVLVAALTLATVLAGLAPQPAGAAVGAGATDAAPSATPAAAPAADRVAARRTRAARAIVKGRPAAGRTLRCAPDRELRRADRMRVVWKKDGRRTATGRTYRVRPRDTGHRIGCRVVTRGPRMVAVSRTVTVVAAPVNTDRPRVVGVPRPGETLTCDPGAWTESPELRVWWKRDGSPAGRGATRGVSEGDLGTRVECEVSGHNAAGGSGRVTSRPVLITATGTPTEPPTSAPVNTSRPYIVGDAVPGETLTCDPGSWTERPTATFTYRWTRNGSPAGTATTYAVSGGDVGSTLVCLVAASNTVGGSGQVASDPVTVREGGDSGGGESGGDGGGDGEDPVPGVVTMVLEAPEDVPGQAILTGPGAPVELLKPAEGTRVETTRELEEGTWRLEVRDSALGGYRYVAESTLWSVDVAEGTNDRIEIELVQLADPDLLQVALVDRTSAALEWRLGAGATGYELRRAAGEVFPEDRADGELVATGLEAGDGGALDDSLQPGSTYAYRLFVQGAGGAWRTGASLLVTTPGEDEIAAAVRPSSVILEDGDSYDVSLDSNGAVVLTLPAGHPAVPVPVGAGVILPPSDVIPEGVVGRATEVSADGRTVTVLAAELEDVFDYLDLDVDMDEIGELDDVPTSSASRGNQAARSGDCDSASLKLDVSNVRPSVVPDGYLRVKVERTFNVPHTVDLDVRVAALVKAQMDLDIQLSGSCSVTLFKKYGTFMAGPVPIAWQVSGDFSASGSLTASLEDVTVQRRVGAWAHPTIGARNSFSGGLIDTDGVVDFGEVTGFEADLSATLGGSFEVGPGAGGGASEAGVGASAGIRGSVDVAKLEVAGSSSSTGTCVSVDVRSSAELGLYAKAFAKAGFIDFSAEGYWKIPGAGVEVHWPGMPLDAPMGCADDPEPEPDPEPTLDPRWTARLVTPGDVNDTALWLGASPDGRYVAHSSLVALTPGSPSDGGLYLTDRRSGARTYLGPYGAGSTGLPRVSRGGDVVVWQTPSGVGPAVWTRDTGRVTHPFNGNGLDYGIFPDLSENGRYVTSFGTRRIDGTAQPVVEVLDRSRGTIKRLIVPWGGGSSAGAISGNGRYVGFISPDDGLVAGDSNGRSDVYVWDTQTGQLARHAFPNGGANSSIDLSYSGERVSALVDGPDEQLVVVWQRGSSNPFRHVGSWQGPCCSAPGISGDGTTVAWVRDNQLVVHRIDRGQLEVATPEGWNFSQSVGPALSSDGRTIIASAYRTAARGDNDGSPDAIAFHRTSWPD